LIGIPLRITIGQKNLADGNVELKSEKPVKISFIRCPRLFRK